MNNKYPFYLERDTPTFSQQFRDMADAMKIMEELKASNKPKEDKKEPKPSVVKTFLLIGLGTFAMIPIIMWIQFTVFLDILTKAKHLPLP